MEELKDLEELHLGSNRIVRVIGLEDGHPHLRVLNLAANLLDDVDEVIILASLKQLSDLRLDKNSFVPVMEKDLAAYRLRIVHMLPMLTVLDGCPIKPEEKVAAVNKISPPASVVAALEHITLVKRHAKRYAKILAVDIMQSNRLRPIVLCGSSNGNKRYAAFCNMDIT